LNWGNLRHLIRILAGYYGTEARDWNKDSQVHKYNCVPRPHTRFQKMFC